MSPRVLLVDDHQLLAQAIMISLRTAAVVAELADLADREALLEKVRRDRPDLVLLDLHLGGNIGDGSTLVAPFTEAGTRVLVVTASTDPCHLGTALEAGAVGVVSKTQPFDDLVAGILRVARGEDAMPPEERARILAECQATRAQRERAMEPFDRLTARERQVLRALGHGTPVAGIAKEWVVSEATVRSQVRGVLTKLGVGSQLEAVAAALRTGWLAQPE